METDAETHSCRFCRPPAAFEQHARKVVPVADGTLILDRSRIVNESTSASVPAVATPLGRFLDVTAR